MRPSEVLDIALVVLAKAPRPGFVKTRLTPPYTPSQAASLAAAALTDTLDAVARTPVAQRVLALSGDAVGWERGGFTVLPQRGDGLDERITYAIDDVWQRWQLPILLVGMDTPQVGVAELTAAAAVLMSSDSLPSIAVLGPAADGGFWSLGVRAPLPQGLIGVPMSASHTGAATAARLRAAGLDVHLLATRCDVDDARTAALVAESAPGTAFARAHAALQPQGLTA